MAKSNGRRRQGKSGEEARVADQAKLPARVTTNRPKIGARDVEDPKVAWDLDLDPALDRDRELEQIVRRMLDLLGEDPDREGLVRTPQRVANAMKWLTRGQGLEVESVVGDALFEEAHESMVMVRDIELYSLCEHHLLPFFGKAHIAYIPDGHIVGLSKLPRIVEVFARRLQVQERLTEQIAEAIQDVLEPRGVGVVIEAYHLCMMMRGVEKQNSKTITSALRGSFRSDARTRDEFLQLAHVSSTPLR
jgi:GTP cyclohydrolase IA